MSQSVSLQLQGLQIGLANLKKSIEKESDMLNSLQEQKSYNAENEIRKKRIKIYFRKWKDQLLQQLIRSKTTHQSKSSISVKKQEKNSNSFSPRKNSPVETQINQETSNSKSPSHKTSSTIIIHRKKPYNSVERTRQLISLVLTSSSDDELLLNVIRHNQNMEDMEDSDSFYDSFDSDEEEKSFDNTESDVESEVFLSQDKMIDLSDSDFDGDDEIPEEIESERKPKALTRLKRILEKLDLHDEEEKKRKEALEEKRRQNQRDEETQKDFESDQEKEQQKVEQGTKVNEFTQKDETGDKENTEDKENLPETNEENTQKDINENKENLPETKVNEYTQNNVDENKENTENKENLPEANEENAENKESNSQQKEQQKIDENKPEMEQNPQ